MPMPSLILAGRTEDVLATVGDAKRLLSATEQRRAARLRFARDRADFTAAHALIRICAARTISVDPAGLTVLQRCETCGGDHGRPVIEGRPGLQVSLSHTRGYVVAIAGHGHVGVDVERADGAPIDARAMRLVLSAHELAAVESSPLPRQAFARQWVRKEALVKIGRARLDALSAADLSELPLPPTGGEPHATQWQGCHLLEWSSASDGVVGCGVSAAPARLELIGSGRVSGGVAGGLSTDKMIGRTCRPQRGRGA